MNNLTKYVISLPSAQDRRRHILSEFSVLHISFNFFNAIEPSIMKNIAEKHLINIKESNLRMVKYVAY